MLQRAAVLAMAMLLTGCSFSDDTKRAEARIVDFHKALDAGAFAAIYDGSGDELKAVTKKSDFVRLLEAVHRKLGAFGQGKSVGWNVNATTGGQFVTINYEARYQRGTANEQFVYRLKGDRTLLVGYHVNSDALILN